MEEVLFKKTKLASNEPKAQSITKSIALMLTKSLLSYTFVEESGFVEFMANPNIAPQYEIPCRTTFSTNYVPKLFADTQIKMKGVLKLDLLSLLSLSITSDGRTSAAVDKYMFVLLNTSGLSTALRPYLPLFLESLLELPILRGDTLVPYEQVVAQLETDTISVSASIGLENSSRFHCGAFSHTAVLMLQLEPAKYSRCVTWIRELLYQTQFTVERLRILASKIANDVAQVKRKGNKVVSDLMKGLVYNQDSNYYTYVHVDSNYYTCVHVASNYYTCVHVASNYYTYVHVDSNYYTCVHVASNYYTCVHVASNYYTCVHVASNYYTCVHVDSNHYTCVHVASNYYTCIHVDSNYYTCVHVDSNYYMCVHVDSNYYTCVHVDSNYYTYVHVDSNYYTCVHVASNYYTCVHVESNYYTCVHVDSNYYTCVHADSNHYMYVHVDSNHYSSSMLRQHKFLTSLLERLESPAMSQKVLQELEEVRAVLTQPANIVVHLAADMDKLPGDPAEPWAQMLPSGVNPKRIKLAVTPDWALLTPPCEQKNGSCVVRLAPRWVP
uniref:Uncharacterized protein n=1 Tax=Timema monikensis TaxID=170555 RepID=A0A7R9HPT7_9NEOP|nr:unnamed protein product [Timema monikensis]